jgi:hypothetical protein
MPGASSPTAGSRRPTPPGTTRPHAVDALLLDGALSEARVAADPDAENAIERLAAATQLDKARFGAVVFDNNSPATVLDAIASLRGEELAFGAVILNAGGLPKVDDSGAPRTLDNGTSELFAMNVGGHAVLIDALMEAGLLAAVARGEHVDDGYDMMVDYGLIKLFGTLWMRDLAANHGYRALAVSPGMTGGTSVMDNLPLPMRLMFRYIALPLFKLMGNAHDVGVGAARYLQAVEDDTLRAGGFYASPGGKVSGKLTEQDPALQPLLNDGELQATVAAFLASEVARHRADHEAAR